MIINYHRAQVETFRTAFNASDPATTKSTSYTLAGGAGIRSPRVACVGGRYALIAGGFTSAAACSPRVHLLDTINPPPAGSALPVIATLGGSGSGAGAGGGAVAVAASMHGGAAGFFDGETLDVFELPTDETGRSQ